MSGLVMVGVGGFAVGLSLRSEGWAIVLGVGGMMLAYLGGYQIGAGQ